MSEGFNSRPKSIPAEDPPVNANDNAEQETIGSPKEKPLMVGDFRAGDNLMSESELEFKNRIHEIAEQEAREHEEAEARKVKKRDAYATRKNEQDKVRLEGIKQDRDSEKLTSGTLEEILYKDRTNKENRLKFNDIMKRVREVFPSNKPKELKEIFPAQPLKDNPAEKDPIFSEPAEQSRASKIKSAKTPEEVAALRKERLKDERWAYKNLEKKYLDSYTKYLKDNHTSVRLAKSIFKTKESVELENLKKEYYAARFNFLREFEDKKMESVESKQEELRSKLREAHAANADKKITDVLENRLIENERKVKAELALERVAATKNFLQEKNKARFEEFSIAKKTGFGKLAGWASRAGRVASESLRVVDKGRKELWNKIPESVRPWVAGALRVGLSVAVAGLVVAESTTVDADISKDVLIPLLALKSLTFGAGATAAGTYGAGKGYEKFIGKPAQQAAKNKTEKHESFSSQALEKNDESFTGLASRSNEATLKAKTALVSTTGTLLASFGLGALLPISLIESSLHSVQKFAPVGKFLHMLSGLDQAASGVHAHADAVKEAITQSQPAPGFNGFEVRPTAADLRSKGAGFLMQQLHKTLNTTPGLEHSAVADLMKGDPSKIAERLGFPHGNLEGSLQEKDWLEFTKNHELILHRGSKSILVLNETIAQGMESNSQAAESAAGVHEFLSTNARHISHAAQEHASKMSYDGKVHPADAGRESDAAANLKTHDANVGQLHTTDTAPRPESASVKPEIAPKPETPSVAPHEQGHPAPDTSGHSDAVVNSFKISVDPHQFHVYTDAKGHVTAFGGTDSDDTVKQATAWAIKNNSPIFVDSPFPDGTGNTIHQMVQLSPDGSNDVNLEPNWNAGHPEDLISVPTVDQNTFNKVIL